MSDLLSRLNENIPAELRERRQWITWQAQERDGKPTKIPCDCRGIPCSVTDERAYGSFADALECVRQSAATGVGFVFTENDPYCGIDIDDCCNPDTGAIDDWAYAEIASIDSYAEYSPSRSGVHLIVKAKPPEGKGRKSGPRECYYSGRFFTMTGDLLDRCKDGYNTVADRQAELDEWHARTFQPRQEQPRKSWSHPNTASDNDLFRKIENSKQGAKFARLWRGDTSDYAGDDSAADLALCSMLVWWCGGDGARVDRLFRMSGLMRSKWDAARGATTYGGLTLARASQQSSVYQSDHTPIGPDVKFETVPTNPNEAKPAGKPRKFKWLRELSEPPKTDQWVWRGYLARNSITLLSAYWKAGKTTLLTHLLRECESGGSLFGEPVDPTTVLYITEEHERIWYSRRDTLGLDKTRDTTGLMSQPFKSRPSNLQWAQLVEEVTDYVREHGFGLVIFDTLAKLWPVREENDASGVDEALMPLWRIAEAGASVLIVHHLRKGAGSEYTASRGSGALSAFPEILMELTRVDPSSKTCAKRQLSAIGRYSETPAERKAELVNGRYVVLGQDNGEDSVNGNLSSKDSMILDIIRHGSETGVGMTSDAIRNALKDRGEGIRDQAVSDCISSLYAKKLITFSGMMRSKTNPRIWSIVSTDDVPPLGVKNQNEMPGEADGGRKTTELDMNAGSEYDAYNAAQRELEADFFGSQTEESDE